MKNFWLYLHFPHLQLDTITSDNADMQQQPVVILHGRKNTIVQSNQAAAEAGIQIGMGLGTAAALEHNLQVLPYQYDVENTRLQELATHLYQVTSDICLFAPNGLLLRIHHMLGLYGGLDPYWQKLQQQLKPFAVTYDFATGHSALAARMLARQHYNQVHQAIDTLKHAVNQCPITATELDHKVQEKLSRVGIHKVGELLTLPLKDIAKRFDAELVTYLGRLSGEFYHPLSFYTPQSQFERYLELLYDITHTQHLHKPLGKLLDALEHFLKVRDLLTNRITLRFFQRDGEPINLDVGSAQGEYQAKKWLQLSQLKLESLKLQAPIYGLRLNTGQTQLRSPEKADLFRAAQGSLNTLQLISLLEAKLGEHSVLKVTLKDDFRPEVVSQYQSIEDAHNDPAMCLHAMRPSFLLPAPQHLQDKVNIISGPERLHTGWWDNQQVIRDYYIARNHQGQWLWIFKTPHQQWFVQGLFS